MAPYVPTDDPQKLNMARGGDASALHHEELRKYGPAPPNYSVERVRRDNLARDAQNTKVREYIIRYKDLSDTTRKHAQREHPLSPEGLAKNPAPILHDEPEIVRPAFPGIIDVPIKYKSSTQLKWQYFDTWSKALAAALESHKLPSKHTKDKLVTDADIRATLKMLTPKQRADPRNATLYHISDRNTIIFKDEPDVAMVAREYGSSLVVVCPFTEADKTGWNRFYNITNRPPIYARWSTGPQAQGPPVVLGCLPIQNLTALTADKVFDVMWFFLDVNPNFKPIWHVQIYSSVNTQADATKMGYPVTAFSPRVYLWCLVFLHRSTLMGGAIPDNHLACWIWQFGNHLANKCKPQKRMLPFKYDPEKFPEYQKKYPGGVQTLNHERLTRMIMNPSVRLNDVWIGHYALLWDQAIEARLEYHLDPTDAKWSVFASKIAAARKVPI